MQAGLKLSDRTHRWSYPVLHPRGKYFVPEQFSFPIINTSFPCKKYWDFVKVCKETEAILWAGVSRKERFLSSCGY